MDPLFVETMLNEKKVTARDMEMAQWYEESQATKVRQPRRASGLLGRLHASLVATLQAPTAGDERGELMHHRTLVSLAVGAVILLSACSSGGASVVPMETSGPPTAEISVAPADTAAPRVAVGAANCAQSDKPGQVTGQIKPH